MRERYTLNWFLLNARNADVAEFLRRKRLLSDSGFAGLPDGDISDLEQCFRSMAPMDLEHCEAAFHEVYRMGSRAGRDAIITASRSKNLVTSEDAALLQHLGSMTYLDAVFWTYLNRPRYWDVACCVAEADALGVSAWEKHSKVPKVVPKTDTASLAAFGAALGRYFHTMEGRGDRCEVKVCDRSERLHLFCFLESPPLALPEWVQEGLRRRAHKPVEPLTFMYSQLDGELDIHFKGKRGTIWDLMSLFAQHILGQRKLEPPASGRGSYRLDQFKRREGVRFIIDSNSGITSVGVRRIRLTPQLGEICHHTIEGSAANAGASIYDKLEKLDTVFKLNEMDVTQVELAVRFERTALHRQRTINTVVTPPNRCSLGYDERELIVRKMLVASGVEPKDEP